MTDTATDSSAISLTELTANFASLAWGPWLLLLLLGGGLFFLCHSGLKPFRYLGHAVDLLRGRFDDPKDPGDITHRAALSAALAGTVGMGNIAGVALAIHIAGPGAIFWMWLTAILGIATKFYTCTLAVMYRGTDDQGRIQGGPMYVIQQALPKSFMPLAWLFAAAGMIGSLPAVQANQLVEALREVVLIPSGWLAADTHPERANMLLGGAIALLTAVVIFGGLKRIATLATALVPGMTLLYAGAAIIALLLNAASIPGVFALIIEDAFTGAAAAGGSLWFVLVTGIRRGAYSNEAGIGSEAMAHGAARTKEPVREGLVAALGPIVDTLMVCTATALMILLSGVWQTSDASGVALTADAFRTLLGPVGTVIIIACVTCFSLTTIFTYSYYGEKCLSFLAGSRYGVLYRYIAVVSVFLFAIVSLETAINVIDGAFALMAIPTMTAALWLAPKVKAEAQRYFATLDP